MSLDVIQFLVEDFLFKYDELQKSKSSIDASLHRIFEGYETQLRGTVTDIACLQDVDKNILYLLNCAVDDCLVESAESLLSMAKRRFSKQAKSLETKTRNDLKEYLKKLESSISHHRGSSVSAPHKPASIPLLNFVVHGFEDQFVKIVEKISPGSQPNMRAVGIVGIGGSGKTTLATMLFDSREVRERYQIMIWASLTSTLNKKESNRGSVFGEIMSGVQNNESLKKMLQEVKSYQGGSKMSDHVLDNYIKQFKDTLKRNSGKYLIVLDDVWETDYWFAKEEATKAPEAPEDGKAKCILSREWIKKTGGTVLVTSRLEEMAENIVGKENLYMISPVSKDACFDIFLDRATKDNRYFSREDERLLKLRKDIEGRCFGLPLAACTVADIMVAKEEEEAEAKKKLEAAEAEASKAETENDKAEQEGAADSSKPAEEEGKTSTPKAEGDAKGEADASNPAEVGGEPKAEAEQAEAELSKGKADASQPVEAVGETADPEAVAETEGESDASNPAEAVGESKAEAGAESGKGEAGAEGKADASKTKAETEGDAADASKAKAKAETGVDAAKPKAESEAAALETKAEADVSAN